LFGVRLVGVNDESGKELLFSIVLVVALMLLGKLLRTLTRGVTRRGERTAFWARQGIHVFTAVVLVLGVASIWSDDSGRLTTAAGLLTAGVAFALQRVITALAGYFLILRGKTFNVGDSSLGGRSYARSTAASTVSSARRTAAPTEGSSAAARAAAVESFRYRESAHSIRAVASLSSRGGDLRHRLYADVLSLLLRRPHERVRHRRVQHGGDGEQVLAFLRPDAMEVLGVGLATSVEESGRTPRAAARPHRRRNW
jgi:hypothetical protein